MWWVRQLHEIPSGGIAIGIELCLSLLFSTDPCLSRPLTRYVHASTLPRPEYPRQIHSSFLMTD
jgi:hypothetical protein